MLKLGNMVGARLVELPGVDRELAFALVTETMTEAERNFGRTEDGRVLARFALEAAIELLSRPVKVLDYLPSLAVREAHNRLAG